MYPLPPAYPSKSQYLTASHSTPKNLTVPNSTLQIWGLQIGVLPYLPPFSDQLISIKLAFSSMKIAS